MKLRRMLPRLFVESLLIILSVLVALAVNDWRAGRERRTRTAEARQAFAREISANREQLASDQILPHHRRLQAIYRKAVDENAADPGALFDTGLHPPALRDAAWRAFSGGTIFADFPAERVLLLSDIYHAQSDLERKNAEFLTLLSVPRADRETPSYQRDVARAIWMFLNDLVPAEERLIRNYEQVLAKMEVSEDGK